MDPRFTSNSHDQPQIWSKAGNRVSPRYDSGFGSLSITSGGVSMATEQAPPRPPTLIGGAAIPEEQCESGVFSGNIGAFYGDDADTDGRVHGDQQVPVGDFAVNTVLPPSKELASMSISREPEVLRTVRMAKPVPVTTVAEKTTKSSGRPRVRRPHRNYSNATLGSNSARSSTSSPPNSGGLQSLPANHLGNNNSGVFCDSRLPQSCDTGYGGSQPSSMSSMDNFSGNSAMNLAWPTIDIFELQQNVQYFLPNRDGDT